MRTILCILLSFFSFEDNLEKLATDGAEKASTQLKEFPHPLYQVYTPAGSGSFYIDENGEEIHFEKGMESMIKSMCRKDSIVVDFGADIGVHTMTMAKSVGPNGLVIAVEPQKKLFCELLFNLKLNGLLKFLDCSFPTMELSLRALRGEQMCNVAPLHFSPEELSLDSLELKNVSLIRFAEYEEVALSGAEKTIQENSPVVFIKGDRLQKFEEFFTKNDYELLHIHSDHYLATPRK